MTCSMSRRGNCWHYAVVESFFGTLKTELIYRRPWPTRESVHQAVAACIELDYNTKRRYSFLGQQSPAQFEKEHQDGIKEAAQQTCSQNRRKLTGSKLVRSTSYVRTE